MKKLTLLLLTLIASIGTVFGQGITNYARSGSVHPATDAPTTFWAEGVTRTTQTELNGLVDGNKNACYIGGYTAETGGTEMINSFYIDLGDETLNYKTINMYWEGAYAKGYKIYGSNSTDNLKTEELVSQSEAPKTGADNPQVHTLAEAKSYRYLYFDFSAATAANYGWGVKMFEIEVYEAYTPTATTVTATAATTTLSVGATTTITTTVLDQIGNPFDPTTSSYDIADKTIVSIAGNTVTALKAGTTTVTYKADGVSATAITFTVQAQQLTTVVANKSFAQVGDNVTFTAYDQTNNVISSGVTYKIGETAISNSYTVTASDAGNITVTASYTGSEDKTTSFYVLTSADAPRIPLDIKTAVYTNGETSYNGTYVEQNDWGTKTKGSGKITLNKNGVDYSLILVKGCKQYYMGNTATLGTGGGGCTPDFVPSTNGCKELSLDLFTTTAASGSLLFEQYDGSSNTEKAFGPLTPNEWNRIRIDVSNATKLHTITLQMNNAEDVLVSNVYFTPSATDQGNLRFRTFNIEPGSTSATITVKADYEDEVTTRDVHFIVYDASGNLVTYISGKSGIEKSVKLTQFHGAALTADTNYETLTCYAYEANGTQPETTVSRDARLYTIPLTLKSVAASRELLKQTYAKKETTQETPEWIRETNYYIYDTDDASTNPSTTAFAMVSETPTGLITDVNTTNGVCKIAANMSGQATIRLTASNGVGNTVTQDFTISVYETELDVTFTTAGGTTYTNKTGSMGSLSSIITTAGATLADVTSLTINSGNLSSADIETIRFMAGVKYGVGDAKYHFDNGADIASYQDATQGKLTTLDLTGATFAGDGGVIAALPIKNEDGTDGWYEWLDYSSLHDIPHYAFMGCINLETVTLPENIEKIDEYAFQQCANLTTVKNTDKVKEFGGFCFMYDAKLTSIAIGDECTSIGYSAFQSCRAMTLDATTNKGGRLPESLTFIGTYAFASTGITQVVYPNSASIAHMYTGVFYDCKSLTTAYLPSTLKTIGYQSFEGDEALTTLTFYDAATPSYDGTTNLPTTTSNTYNNVLNIVAAAFNNCQVLSDESFQGFTDAGNNSGKAVMMGWTAFSDCKKMTAATAQKLLYNFLDGSDEKGADDATVLRDGEGGNDDHALPRNLFSGCTGITEDITIPAGIVAIGSECFKGILAPNITVEKDVATLGDRAFENCTSTKRITFKSATAPTCTQELSAVTGKDGEGKDIITFYDPFNNIEPNNITIAFEGEADYKTYRASVPFMRQMTKTVENADLASLDSYTIAPQFGGDFKITRAFSKGWNTLALPFGSLASGKDVNGVAKFKAAFGGETNFDHISTYRGVKGSTFMFMKMDDADELKDFEPVMVKLKNAVTTAITFEDVDINYNHTDNLLIAAERMASATVSLPKDSYSDKGQLKDLAGDFNFVGTYKVLLNGSATDMTYLQDGDYIIQNNGGTTVFVECKSGNRYGLQAFRGWFQKNAGASAKPSVMSIMDCDMNQTVTEIIGVVNTETGEMMTPQDIYSIDGQLIRKAATSVNGLSKGLYIMGGKKIIVK